MTVALPHSLIMITWHARLTKGSPPCVFHQGLQSRMADDRRLPLVYLILILVLFARRYDILLFGANILRIIDTVGMDMET